MSFSTMIRSTGAAATEGYGNTVNSLSVTESRIADNDICEGDYRKRMKEILKDTDRKRAGQRLQAFWNWYLGHFESGSKNWHNGQERLFAMLNGVCRGKIKDWLWYAKPFNLAA